MLFRQPIGIFCLSLTVKKLFKSIDLAGNFVRVEKLGISGILTAKFYFVSTQPSKGTSFWQTASFEPMYVQIGSTLAVWTVEAMV
jgi:hypothetical protein